MFKPMYDGKDPVSMLYESRQIFINGEITAQDMDYAIAQVLALNAEDPDSDIYIIIDSPGGEVPAGLALYNACQYVSNDIITIGIGMCASMGSFLLAAGTKGKRFAFKDCEIMFHRVSGGYQGTSADVKIWSARLLRDQNKANEYLSEFSGLSIEEIEKLTDRDNFMTPEEALEHGFIDRVITTQEDMAEYLKSLKESDGE